MDNDLMKWFTEVWHYHLFQLGKTNITTKSVVILLILLFLLFFITGILKKLLVRRVFPRYGIDVGVAQSISTIIRYVLLIIGLVVIFQTTGIDLSALGLLVGALGIGIGFGLQNITNNFISGIIILFERPVKVGDRIEIDDLQGNIINISARSTTVITNDNIAVIVPNSDLISNRVINWSLNNKQVRLNFPVGVSYKEDPANIRRLLIEVASNNAGVLKTPEPDVLFESFGDSSLNFILRIWTLDYSDTPMVLKSQLYYAIFEKFKEHDIEIPYPQRDIHIKSGNAAAIGLNAD
ncbi:MAG: mechanosensitive ion channel [Bacteroidales bacterium]|nr:mechanosensitive ion channel [Bacteroidales bacterium]